MTTTFMTSVGRSRERPGRVGDGETANKSDFVITPCVLSAGQDRY